MFLCNSESFYLFLPLFDVYIWYFASQGSEPMFSAMAMPAHVKHNDQQYAPPPSQQQPPQQQQGSPYASHNAMAPQSPPNHR